MVAQYTATPTAVDPEVDSSAAFFLTPDGTATAAQPELRAPVPPVERPPARQGDASRSTSTSPTGVTAVANGVLVPKRRPRGRRTDLELPYSASRWRPSSCSSPPATSTSSQRGRHRRRRRARRDRRRRSTAQLEPALPTSRRTSRWMQGARRATTRSASTARSSSTTTLGFALETQTLSHLRPALVHRRCRRACWEPTMVHELAHQWFGDSVAPVRVERPVAQRGPRDVVREPLRRGARPARGGHRREARRPRGAACARSTRQGDPLRAQYGPVAVPRSDGTLERPVQPERLRRAGRSCSTRCASEIGDGRVRRASSARG